MPTSARPLLVAFVDRVYYSQSFTIEPEDIVDRWSFDEGSGEPKG
jgi:hypothetical protein